MKYTYDLKCPCCKRDNLVNTTCRTPLPVIYCDDCDMIELKIVRVHVDDVAVDGQDNVLLFHHLNHQRST